MMTKTKLINEIRENTARTQTKADIEDIFNTAIDVIMGQVAAGNSVQITGFGTFECTERSARCGRNPQTGETMMVPAKKAPKFKPGKVFKDKVEGK